MNYAKWQHYLRARFFNFLRNDTAALAEYRLALQAAPEFARAAASIGFIYAKQGVYDAAADSFRKVVQLDPEDAEMHFDLGFVLEKNRQYSEAIEAFDAVLRLEPKFDRAWYGKGMSLAALGDHRAAAAALLEAANLQPMNPHAWYALGMAHHHLHEPDRVKEIIMRLHRFDPRMTRQLIHETGRSDLSYLVQDLLA